MPIARAAASSALVQAKSVTGTPRRASRDRRKRPTRRREKRRAATISQAAIRAVWRSGGLAVELVVGLAVGRSGGRADREAA
jgi:hypothetical protein